MLKIDIRTITAFLLFALVATALPFGVSAQNAPKNTDFEGRVLNRKNREPIIGAAVMLTQYGITTATDTEGNFVFRNVPEGETPISIRAVYMVAFDGRVAIKSGMKPQVFLVDEATFALEEVAIVAKSSKTGASTASTISRSAIDHLQATSLGDVMALLPGQLTSNPTMTSPSKPTLRQVSGDDMNSMGVAIVMNGAPVSNNANLQVGNTAQSGTLTTGFTSTAGSGIDMRRISADNIESVEVIRGIPSVEHGDLTSGVIIVNPKAGASHYQARLKISPTLTQTSIGKGFALGQKGGSLSVDVDYANSLADERRPYRGFRRLTSDALYTKTFKGKVNTTTGIGFYSDLDAQKLDPSDARYQRVRSAENTGYNFNTNILWQIDRNFLKSLRFNASVNYAEQKGYTQEMQGDFGYMITTATKDGTVASNRDESILDAGGNIITNTHRPEFAARTNILPYEFLTKTSTYGKPLNTFVKATANMLYADLWGISNRIVAGAEWKMDVNYGRGRVFDPLMPPSAGIRMRPYTDIPALNQVSAYIEDNLMRKLGERELKLQIGLRYDIIQPGRDEGRNVLSPRVNGSFEIIPRVLTLHAGWGITAKAPPLVYLYPDNAYFDYINFSNIGTAAAEEQKLSILTTRAFDTSNPGLKIATNRKSEIGLDIAIGDMDLNIVAFDENLENGYSFGSDFGTFRIFELTKYKGVERDGTYPSLTVDAAATKNVVASYLTPLNNRSTRTQGVEFDFNFGRIDAIRTSFVLNGAWMKTTRESTGYYFYQKSQDAAGNYKDIGVYLPIDNSVAERFSTNLRVIHNIPKISFLVSLSIQTIWSDSHKYTGLDASKFPIGYLDVDNGLEFVPLAAGETIDPDIQRPENRNRYTTEWYRPLWLFNLRLTKEIKETLGFTFFLNNLFMHQPLEESKRTAGNFTQRNPSQFFGFEAWVKF